MLNIEVKKAIFNDPYTIVLWSDGTKTVVKCQDGDEYDRERGVLACIAKMATGNTGRYNNLVKEALRFDPQQIELEAAGGKFIRVGSVVKWTVSGYPQKVVRIEEDGFGNYKIIVDDCSDYYFWSDSIKDLWYVVG